MDIPTVLVQLKIYVHKLFLCMTGGLPCTSHYGNGRGPGQHYANHWMVAKIHQPRHVAQWTPTSRGVDECGLMLFLAKEYDQEALAKAIWDFSGVIMVLHYRDIEDSKPKEDPKIKKKQVPVKALHIEIN